MIKKIQLPFLWYFFLSFLDLIPNLDNLFSLSYLPNINSSKFSYPVMFLLFLLLFPIWNNSFFFLPHLLLLSTFNFNMNLYQINASFWNFWSFFWHRHNVRNVRNIFFLFDLDDFKRFIASNKIHSALFKKLNVNFENEWPHLLICTNINKNKKSNSKLNKNKR